MRQLTPDEQARRRGVYRQLAELEAHGLVTARFTWKKDGRPATASDVADRNTYNDVQVAIRSTPLTYSTSERPADVTAGAWKLFLAIRDCGILQTLADADAAAKT